MNFEELIETLSKGSATAVTTLESLVAELEALKAYLYVQTPVEQALRTEIDKNLKQPRVIFVCGSSGDGKSELFRRIHSDYATKVRFHLDATHSFDPQKDAIQTLDDQFSAFKAGNQSLVVGINIGMLGNYAADGNPTHSDIKSAISKYLEPSEAENPTCAFVDFRNYPKFRITSQHVDAQFIGQLLERLVTSEPNNPFFVAFERTNRESQLARNFYLLQIPEVREKILDVLLHAHLRYDQFLTARTVLDFVHRILTGDGYLFDNIFRLSGSDLLEALQKLDPCTKRSKRLDLFRIRTKLELFETEFLEFRDAASEFLGTKALEPSSWIRFFYMMQDVEIGNNYHQSIAADLKETLFDDYRQFWLLHSEYDGHRDKRTKLREFYKDVLIRGLISFANRIAPEIKKDRFFLGKLNGYAMSAKAYLQPSLNRIAHAAGSKELRHFEIILDLDEKPLVPIRVTVAFLELLQRIIRGYRPNKHDKTSVVVLEELVDAVTRQVRTSDSLHIQYGHHEWVLRNDVSNDEIVVES